MDIRARLGKASSVFQRLRPISKCSSIKNDVKLRLYSSIVVPTGIYASEMWKTTNKINKMIGVFYRRCLGNILGISWRDHITNDEVMARPGTTRHSDNQKKTICWSHSATPNNQSSQSGLRMDTRRWQEDGRTWQDTLKEDLHTLGVDWSDARDTANDRARWRQLVTQCSAQNGRN